MPVFEGKDEEWLAHKVKVSKTEEEEPLSVGKNPCQKLNELYHGIKYEIENPDLQSDVKEDHCFRAKVTVEDSVYEGQGPNKKIAKAEAAKLALDGLKTLDRLEARIQELEAKRVRKQVEKSEFMTRRFEERGKRIDEYRNRERKQPPLPKNAVMKLNEHHKSLEYDFLAQGGVPWNKTFSVAVTVEGKKYIATGNNKKNAKLEVAETVLKALGLWTEDDQKVKDEYYGKDGQEKRRKLMGVSQDGGATGQEGGATSQEGAAVKKTGGSQNRGRGNVRGRGRGWNEGHWRGGGGGPIRGGRGQPWGRGGPQRGRGGGRGRGRGRGSFMNEGPIHFVRPNNYENDGFAASGKTFDSQGPQQSAEASSQDHPQAPSQPYPDVPPQPFPDPLFADVPPYGDQGQAPGYQQGEPLQNLQYSQKW